MALAVAHGEQQIIKVDIELALITEFAVRADRQGGYRRDVPESEQALVLAQLPEERPFQPGPPAIARLSSGIKAATGIEDPFGTKQTGETTQALQLG